MRMPELQGEKRARVVQCGFGGYDRRQPTPEGAFSKRGLPRECPAKPGEKGEKPIGEKTTKDGSPPPSSSPGSAPPPPG